MRDEVFDIKIFDKLFHQIVVFGGRLTSDNTLVGYASERADGPVLNE